MSFMEDGQFHENVAVVKLGIALVPTSGASNKLSCSRLLYYLLDCGSCQPSRACPSYAHQDGTPASPQTLTVPRIHVTAMALKIVQQTVQTPE